ncbi:amino acid ABC transporter permease [Sporichthya polymorpha]|uniref:amino acid ABC transporter permease n=1 Tax=Sporichthya polymorpha TaxID=35751 RepID=UPI00036F9CAC|nr:amino acid ABC transporter permease [Sporichthya polymorpha]
MSLVLFDVPGPRARRRARIFGALAIAVFAALVGWVIWRLDQREQFDSTLWDPFTDRGIQKAIARGLGATIRAALFAIVLALLLGILLAAGRLSTRRWLRWPCVAFVEFFRATPVVILILFLFIAFSGDFEPVGDDLSDALPERLAAILGTDQLGTLAPLVIALTLYNGAVLAEVFRAGILAVPKGQREAAAAVGLTERQIMRQVLLPQATRIMLPSIVSQAVVALKDTSLGFIIAYPELVRVGRNIYDTRYNIIPTVIVITIIYVALNMAVDAFARWLERRQARRYSRAAVTQAAAVTDAT